MRASQVLRAVSSVLAAACISTTSALVPVSPATAATTTPLAPGDEYVALGSSFGSGPGVPRTIDPFCARSSGNYAHLLAAALELQLEDVTCAAATSANITDTPQTLLLGGRRAPQVDSVSATTDLVTITVGGNDVNYIGDLWRNSCSAPNNAPVPAVFAALCTPPDPAATQEALDVVTANLASTVLAVRSKAPDARVVLVDYLTLLPRNAKPCAALPLTSEQIKSSLDVARRLQLATKHAAQQTGAELVELSKASRDHDVCSDDRWVTVWAFSPDFLTGGAVPYHPNAAGMSAAADLLAEHLL